MSYHYAIFSAHFQPHRGGIESLTEGLARQLVADGHEVDIVTSQLSASDLVHEHNSAGFEIWRLPSWPLMDGRLPITQVGKSHSELLDSLSQKKIDRILINARFYTHSIDALRFSKKHSIPALVLDHGSEYLALGSVPADFAIKIYEHLITAVDKCYEPRFAGISQKSLEHLERFGIHSDCVINNAIDADEFCNMASSRDFRLELGLTSNQELVCFIGRLTPEKGAAELVEAAQLLDKRYIIALAGDGFLRTELQELKVPNVRFLGMLNRSDLSALLRQSSCFCLPTRSEGFCTSLLESSSWGVPAVIPLVGGTTEVLGDSPETGIVLENRTPAHIADGIVKACEQSHNEALKTNLKRRVRKWCSWSATTQALERAFL